MSFENLVSTVRNDSCCPDLSFRTRVLGFTICLILSIIFGIISVSSVFGLLTGSYTSFIISFTLNSVCSFGSTFFFKGPKAQWKLITDSKRLIPSLVFACSFVMVWISWFVFESKILTLVFIGLSIAAEIFYTLTYIPYGTQFCKKCCKSIFLCEKEEESDITKNIL